MVSHKLPLDSKGVKNIRNEIHVSVTSLWSKANMEGCLQRVHVASMTLRASLTYTHM